VANITQEGTNKDMEIDKRLMDYLYTTFLHPFPKLILKKMNCNKIEEIIRLIKFKSACGYDRITANLIKASAPFISSPLACICNKSLFTGIFPSLLKYSEITPIHKKGDKTDKSNYRPIYLLPTFSKILGKIYI
jgi:hypothetical protein